MKNFILSIRIIILFLSPVSAQVIDILSGAKINLFHFNHFPFISRTIEKGSRLRLIISSPNSIFVQENYCSGGVVANETAKDAHRAHIKIYNDSKGQRLINMKLISLAILLLCSMDTGLYAQAGYFL